MGRFALSLQIIYSIMKANSNADFCPECTLQSRFRVAKLLFTISYEKLSIRILQHNIYLHTKFHQNQSIDFHDLLT